MTIKADVEPEATLRFSRRDDAAFICQESRGGTLELDPRDWPLAQKRTLTRCARILGPFTVETPHGPVTCQDGWLAVDEAGDPYPISAEVFEASMVLVQPA